MYVSRYTDAAEWYVNAHSPPPARPQRISTCVCWNIHAAYTNQEISHRTGSLNRQSEMPPRCVGAPVKASFYLGVARAGGFAAGPCQRSAPAHHNGRLFRARNWINVHRGNLRRFQRASRWNTASPEYFGENRRTGADKCNFWCEHRFCRSALNNRFIMAGRSENSGFRLSIPINRSCSRASINLGLWE